MLNYFELVSQVEVVLGKAIYAHDSFPANKRVLRQKIVFSNLLELYTTTALRARLHQSGKLDFFLALLPFRIEPENKQNTNAFCRAYV